MALDPDTGAFTIDQWSEEDSRRELRAHFEEVELSNTERAMLRRMIAPGELLFRVQANMVDYDRFLRNALMGCDLDTPEGVRRARTIRNEISAVDWQRRMWERLLSHIPEDEEQQGEGQEP